MIKMYLGGTFDPVHNGHIYLAQELVALFGLDKLYLMPCYQAVHKDEVSASASQRLDMLKLAISSFDNLAIDKREIEQTGPSYTFDSLSSIRLSEGDNSVCFVMGMDSLLNFSTWYKSEEIHKLANLVIIERPASSFKISEDALTSFKKDSIERLQLLGFTLLKNHQSLSQFRAGKAVVLKLSSYEISSTEVRALIKKRQNITHLVSKGVAEYIQMHNLYQ